KKDHLDNTPTMVHGNVLEQPAALRTLTVAPGSITSPWVEPDALPSAPADPTCRRDERAVAADLGDDEELVCRSGEQVGFRAGVWRIGVARAEHRGPLHERTGDRPL